MSIITSPQSLVLRIIKKLSETTSIQFLKISFITLLGLVLYFFFKPEALSKGAWSLFTIFVCNILAIVLKPFPMGALSLLAIALLTITKTVTLPIILHGFANDLIWLIVMACFLAKSFVKTGLGARIAYAFVAAFGGTPYGLSYGFLLSAATMSPLIPSTTARTGGIILPVLKSLVQVIGNQKNIAAFLTLTVFHGSVLTSAFFVTANAGNPIVVKIAKSLGVDISWGTWALAALVPGLISLILLPPLIRLFLPCTIANPHAICAHAKEKLHHMGKVTKHEKITLGVFIVLLCLWAGGSLFGVHATEAAILGVGLLLLTNVLSWKDILSEEMAWDTFFWMAILVMMAQELQTMGVTTHFTNCIVQVIPRANWQLALGSLALIYFYSHYFFASTTAHLSSMYGPFLAAAITAGAPPMLAALSLGFMSNLFGGITHYSSGPAPILYSQGYVELKTWWKIGAITGIFYLIVWQVLGPFWWRLLELY